jgi:hypothetical protein
MQICLPWRSKPTKGYFRIPILRLWLRQLKPSTQTRPYICLVGVCEDHVPFLLDLKQVETGSILVTSDPGCGKTNHLRILVESVISLNSPHEVQIAILTNHPEEWSDLTALPGFDQYLAGIFSWYESGSADLINDLVSLGEDRACGRHRGPTTLLIIDNLEHAFEADFEIQNGLHWLLEYGPLSQIRPMASMNAGLCPANDFWMDTFRTFLVGKIASDSLADSLGLAGLNSTKELIPNYEFRAFTGESWTKYYLPRCA